MKDSELKFDRSCHAIYSKQLKKKIRQCIAQHYPKEEREKVFEAFQMQFVDYLKDYRTDLGGKRNFHNGVCGTYDCIAMFSYYKVCKDATSFEEIERIAAELITDSFKGLGTYVNLNRKVYKYLMYNAFRKAKKRCDRWKDYDMRLNPYDNKKPLTYKFYSCPTSEFAREHGFLDVLPALCNSDYAAMEVLHAKLIRTTTLGRGECCDYAICGDKDPYVKEHPEYRDENGGRWNK